MTDTVRASGEAMPAINRRRFLLNTTMAGAAVAVAAPVAAAEPEMSVRERIDWLLAELKEAVLEANPNVRVDISINLDDPDTLLPLMIMGQWATGRYEGDGIYCGGSKWFRNDRYEVVALDQTVKGERGFSVIPVGETDRNKWMRLSESRFESFIGKKIGSEGGEA